MKQHSNQKALELLQRYQQSGDLAVLAELYTPYMEMVLAIGLRYYKDSCKAEDLVMTVYEKLIKKVRTASIKNFYSWLFSLAKNECLMELRKKNYEVSADISNYTSQFMETNQFLHQLEKVQEQKDKQALQQCLEGLKETQQICVNRFYLGNETYKQIADETKLSLKQVKSAIQNGKRNLKNCLEANQNGE